MTSVLSLKTIANQCFGVPFEGGPGVPKSSFGGPEIGVNAQPVVAPGLDLK